MPSRAIPRRVEDFIYYYYAKLVIAPSSGQRGNYRFIIDRYQKLKSGEIKISDYDRELRKQAQERDRCAFCGQSCVTTVVELIPSRLGGPVGLQNQLYACHRCAESKGDRNLIEWWCDVLKRDKDDLPRIPAGLFLKMAYERHLTNFTLDRPCHDIRELW